MCTVMYRGQATFSGLCCRMLLPSFFRAVSLQLLLVSLKVLIGVCKASDGLDIGWSLDVPVL